MMSNDYGNDNTGNTVNVHNPEPIGAIVKRVIEKLKKEANIDG